MRPVRLKPFPFPLYCVTIPTHPSTNINSGKRHHHFDGHLHRDEAVDAVECIFQVLEQVLGILLPLPPAGKRRWSVSVRAASPQSSKWIMACLIGKCLTAALSRYCWRWHRNYSVPLAIWTMDKLTRYICSSCSSCSSSCSHDAMVTMVTVVAQSSTRGGNVLHSSLLFNWFPVCFLFSIMLHYTMPWRLDKIN